LLVLAAAGLWLWRGPRAWDQAKLLYWQRQCLNYSPPEGQVVWEPDPAAAPTLLADAAHYIDGRRQVWLQPASAAVRKPPAPWVRLAPQIVNEEFADCPLPLVYLHERRTTSGLRRLVAAYYCPELPHAGPYPFLLFCVVIEPASLSGTPRILSVSTHMGGPEYDVLARQPFPPIRYFAGQSDPNESSRLSIRYETASRRGTIEGRLLEDGRSVKLTVLDGPGTDPSAWPGAPKVTPMRELDRLDY
jgi:hypothetical protein